MARVLRSAAWALVLGVSMRAVSWSLSVMFVIGALAVVVAQEGQKTTDEQQLMQLEHDWAKAMVNGDIGFLERIYHTDHASVNPAGQLMTRQEEIADARSGGFKAESANVDELRVRVYGGDTAVVMGRTKLKAMNKGHDISGHYRFTDTFVKQDGQWLCVATQATAIATPP